MQILQSYLIDQIIQSRIELLLDCWKISFSLFFHRTTKHIRSSLTCSKGIRTFHQASRFTTVSRRKWRILPILATLSSKTGSGFPAALGTASKEPEAAWNFHRSLTSSLFTRKLKTLGRFLSYLARGYLWPVPALASTSTLRQPD